MTYDILTRKKVTARFRGFLVLKCIIDKISYNIYYIIVLIILGILENKMSMLRDTLRVECRL